jgi:signal transduction histidine kinase
MLRDPHPVRLDDIRQHPRFGWWPAAHPTLTTFLGMPIVDGEEILGELFLANKDGGFTDEDEELLRLLAGHAAIALVNARLYERSRELSIMEERTRIARELHDSMTQKLFSLRLTAEAAATVADGRTAEHLRTITGLAAEAAEELRAIMVGLRPADLAGDGLEPALRKQAELLDRAHGARVTFDTGTGADGNAPGADGDWDGDGDGRRLSPAREQAVYRIAQEATHNALRHGPPSHVHIRLSTTDSRLVLEVIDDGPGFDVEDAEEGPAQAGKAQGRARRRLGLTSMRERAQAADGQLRITSTPGRGTTVRLEVPWRGRHG